MGLVWYDVIEVEIIWRNSLLRRREDVYLYNVLREEWREHRRGPVT